MKYDLMTRWLHAGIAGLVIIQIVCSEFMEPPSPGQTVPAVSLSFFRIHETSGLTAMFVVALHWLWNLTGHVSGGWGHLFPWFSREQRDPFYSDLRAVPRWMHEGIPAQEDQTISLAGAVHGLGLVVVTAMGATGTAVFLGMGPDGSMSGLVAAAREVHGFIANFLYVYLVGHVGMAIIHWWLGHGIIGRMFKLFSK